MIEQMVSIIFWNRKTGLCKKHVFFFIKTDKQNKFNYSTNNNGRNGMYDFFE